ncbi:hypothetical protein VDG1235_4797 [Verrucomicrobiia bacterium DG1235]|nr:hypothetical protein VDG1235_4797 [Verrucomicrobiae bacterium DG1235]
MLTVKSIISIASENYHFSQWSRKSAGHAVSKGWGKRNI